MSSTYPQEFQKALESILDAHGKHSENLIPENNFQVSQRLLAFLFCSDGFIAGYIWVRFRAFLSVTKVWQIGSFAPAAACDSFSDGDGNEAPYTGRRSCGRNKKTSA